VLFIFPVKLFYRFEFLKSGDQDSFYVLLFIHVLLTFKGINACFAGIYYGLNGIINVLIDFKGISELKDCWIDLINIFLAAGRAWKFISIIDFTVLRNLFLLEKRQSKR
jgi:hypothetical protein